MKTSENISVTNYTLQHTNASGGFSYVCKKNNNCFNNMYYTCTNNICTSNFLFNCNLIGTGTDGMGNIGSYEGYGEEYENFSNNMLALQQAYELYRLQQKLEKIWVNKSWFELNLPNEFKIYNSARLMPDDPPFKNTQSSTKVPNFVPNKESFNVSTYIHREASQEQGGIDASAFFGAVGVGGDAASISNSSFRLMSGANGSFSPKIYSSGWKGGSPARISTFSVSKVGTGVSTGANLITTGLAYNQIYNGSAQSITYVDAGVGTAGLIGSYASYFHGVEIPVVGEFVAVYGALRLSWDVGWYMGANYGPSKWYGTNDNKWFK